MNARGCARKPPAVLEPLRGKVEELSAVESVQHRPVFIGFSAIVAKYEREASG